MSCNTTRRAGELKANNAAVVTDGELFVTAYQQRGLRIIIVHLVRHKKILL